VFFLFLWGYSLISVEINEFLTLQYSPQQKRVTLHSTISLLFMILPQYTSALLQDGYLIFFSLYFLLGLSRCTTRGHVASKSLASSAVAKSLG
jgi:hypothetical protein